MEDEEQSKNNLENPPEREEGLQKPIPAIFKGMSDIKRNVSSGTTIGKKIKIPKRVLKVMKAGYLKNQRE